MSYNLTLRNLPALSLGSFSLIRDMPFIWDEAPFFFLSFPSSYSLNSQLSFSGKRACETKGWRDGINRWQLIQMALSARSTSDFYTISRMFPVPVRDRRFRNFRQLSREFVSFWLETLRMANCLDAGRKSPEYSFGTTSGNPVARSLFSFWFPASSGDFPDINKRPTNVKFHIKSALVRANSRKHGNAPSAKHVLHRTPDNSFVSRNSDVLIVKTQPVRSE